MGTTKYNWIRYCYPRGKDSSSYLQGGFLVDPEDSFTKIQHPDLVTLSNLQDRQCLILLGEPGSGKSTVFDEMEDQLKKITSGYIIFVNLKTITTEQFFIDSIVKDEKYVKWQQEQDSKLYLVLDSFDEGFMQLQVLCDLLEGVWRKLDVSRLYLRIACRTGAFPSGFEYELECRFQKKNVHFYRLAPLREKDVETASVDNGYAPQTFVSQVKKYRVEALASQPVTLHMLLKTGSDLPLVKKELYERGCYKLCEEVNPGRSAKARYTGRLSVSQKLDLAAKLAAICMLTNRHFIHTGLDGECQRSGTVQLRAVQSEDDAGAITTEADWKEVLATGLFVDSGHEQLTWTHKSYEEFLAAYYLNARRVTTKQLLHFFTHPSDSQGRFIPQLHQTAAWLCELNASFLDELINRQPNLLFLSDRFSMTDATKKKFVLSILNKSDPAYAEHYWDREFIKELKLPEVIDIINCCLSDSVCSNWAQRRALNIVYYGDMDETVSTILDHFQSWEGDLLDDAFHVLYKLCPDDRLGSMKFFLDHYSYRTNHVVFPLLKRLYPNHLTLMELLKYMLDLFVGGDSTSGYIRSIVQTLSLEQLGKLSDTIANAPKYANRQNSSSVYREVYAELANRMNESEAELLHRFERLEQRMWEHGFMTEPAPKEQPAAKQLKWPPARRVFELAAVLELLDRMESGQTSAWDSLTKHLNPHDLYNKLDFNSNDFLQSVGWKQVNGDTRARILQAAKQFIITPPAAMEDRDRFGYLLNILDAIQLVFMKDKAFLVTLSLEATHRCSEAVTNPQISQYVEGMEIVKLFHRLYREETLNGILRYARRLSWGWGARHTVTSQLVNCWDEDTAFRLLTLMKDETVDLEAFGLIISILLEQRHPTIKQIVASLVDEGWNPSNAEVRERASEAVAIMLDFSEDAGCSMLRTILQENTAYAKSVIERYLTTFRNYSFQEKWPPEAIAELFEWLNANEIKPSYKFNELKTLLLRELEDRKTEESYRQIKLLSERLPNSERVQSAWFFIRNDYLQTSWNPPLPEAIVKTIGRKKKMPIFNGQQLIELIKEILEDYERALHSENPLIFTMWNKNGDKQVPKTENEFSDLIKVRLADQLLEYGIIVSREVELSRHIYEGGTEGERIDIKVDLCTTQKETISLLIEVKGCWNRTLKTAMENQLVRRYMEHHNYDYGMYLIGWFLCDGWKDSKDSRRKTTPAMPINAAKQFFSQQAESLSGTYNKHVSSYIFDATIRS
ncbi:hypothetical protein GMA19_04206 [Paenibacillus polymyxa E681]|uniref:NACHT domain-containing protein n=1 Tax=Paenibacillus polymyxa TaxID=1406 RepID=UPI0001E31AFC|nr:NTPase (NACHT family) [Paenibacillus polymyxa]ADM71976.1 hypothetical protein PPE_04196 [Paenibacillus polymyxa E681]QNV59010.1 hypothetical protein GE561_04217 [Paenibacillus polymyxa E681]QNV63836.1 hypothetical protein GMA19_04206 [Paenibacillus polymyxa E681]